MTVHATSRPIHPLWIRISHWLNAFAVLILVASGWRIYNAAPFFDFSIPNGLTLGGRLGGALQWHFAAMGLLVGNGVFHLATDVFTGRLRRKSFPLSPAMVFHDAHPKNIMAMFVTNTYPGGHREDQGYHWFGGS